MTKVIGVEWELAGPQLSSVELERAEEALGCVLPDDYKNFMLQVNGGHPNKELCFPIRGFPNNPWGILHFIRPIQESDDRSDLINTYYDFLDILPRHLLAIGGTPSGDQLLMVTHGMQYAQIWLYDWYSDSASVHDRIYCVASCFSEFLQSLYI